MSTGVERPYRRDAVLLGAAVGVFGLSFGVVSVAAGLSPAKTCVLSLLVFTGASQFAAVGVTEAGGTVAAALASAMLLAARHAAYGVAMAPVLASTRLGRRLLAAQLIIDESTAMATAQEDTAHRVDAFWVTGITIYCCWNASTAVGALAGSAIGDPEKLGLDAAFTAGFVALLAPQLRRRAGRVAAATGALVALVLIPLTAPGVPILAAAAAVVPAMLFSAPPPEDAGRSPQDER